MNDLGKSISNFFSPLTIQKKGFYSKSLMNESEIVTNSDKICEVYNSNIVIIIIIIFIDDLKSSYRRTNHKRSRHKFC